MTFTASQNRSTTVVEMEIVYRSGMASLFAAQH
jgi:hypothetical protein